MDAFDDYVTHIVDYPNRPDNYEWLEQVYPGVVGRRLPTRIMHYLRNVLRRPRALFEFLRRAARAQFT